MEKLGGYLIALVVIIIVSWFLISPLFKILVIIAAILIAAYLWGVVFNNDKGDKNEDN